MTEIRVAIHIHILSSLCFFHKGFDTKHSSHSPHLANAQNGWLTAFFADCRLNLTADCRLRLIALIIYFSDVHTFLPTQFPWHFRCPLFILKHSCTSCFRNPHYSACQRSICINMTSLYELFSPKIIQPSLKYLHERITYFHLTALCGPLMPFRGHTNCCGR